MRGDFGAVPQQRLGLCRQRNRRQVDTDGDPADDAGFACRTRARFRRGGNGEVSVQAN